MILLVPLAFLASLFAAVSDAWPWWSAGIPFALGAAALFTARRPWHVALAMALVAAALAILRYDVERALHPPSHLATLLPGRTADAARGVVVDEPVLRARAQQLRLRVDAVRLNGEWHATSGYAQVTAGAVPLLHAGQVIEVRGQVTTPERSASPSYARYLRRQGIDATAYFPATSHLAEEAPGRFRAALLSLRRGFASSIEGLLPEPHAALVQGILLGRRTTIPPDLTEALNRSGTSHLVAVSGVNVSIVIAAAGVVLGGLHGPMRRRLPAALVASTALWGFVALVGGSGSVLRAAAMAQLGMVGHVIGRGAGAGALLLWGATFLVAWRPPLIADVSWQLSFLATAGLIWIAPPLAGFTARATAAARLCWLPGLFREALAATVAAQVAVLPILAGTFGQVSIISPITNVLVVALIPPIMAGGFALVLAAAVFPALAPLCAALTWVPTAALLWIVEWSAALPWAVVPSPPWPPLVTLAYLALLAALCAVVEANPAWRVGLATASAPQGPGSPAIPAVAARSLAGTPVTPAGILRRVALLALLALACAGWASAAPLDALRPPALRVDVPHVTGGGLALIRAPDGTRVLVGGGPATNSALALLGDQIRPWDRTVDLVVAADTRDAHVLGLSAVLDRYRVGLLLDAAEDAASAAYRQMRETAHRRGVPRLRADPGTELVVGRSLRLQVLGPAPPARAADTGPRGATLSSPATPASPTMPAMPLILRLQWHDFSLLLAGESGPAQRGVPLAAPFPLQSTILLLPERAARDPYYLQLVRAAAPEIVVVQGARGGAGSDPGALPGAVAPADRGPAASTASPDPQPAQHVTATSGPFRLEVRPDGYRVLPPSGRFG